MTLVLADRSCRGIDIAKSHGVAACVVERTDFSPKFDRVSYSKAVVESLAAANTDLVAMAGFGTVLAKPFFDEYHGRVLNTHPSLLPAFPGWHAVREALAHGAKVSGCTVHVATETVDAGPVVAQESVPVLPDDTEETLHERIKEVERRLYPATIAEFIKTQPTSPATPTSTTPTSTTPTSTTPTPTTPYTRSTST